MEQCEAKRICTCLGEDSKDVNCGLCQCFKSHTYIQMYSGHGLQLSPCFKTLFNQGKCQRPSAWAKMHKDSTVAQWFKAVFFRLAFYLEMKIPQSSFSMKFSQSMRILGTYRVFTNSFMIIIKKVCIKLQITCIQQLTQRFSRCYCFRPTK